MSKKAKELIKQAIESYLVDDGATDLGSCRDAITDILHLAHKRLRKKYDIDNLYNHLFPSSFSIFKDELMDAEHKRIARIKRKDLPLHIHDNFEFEESKDFLMARLKHEVRTE
jgi:hypothetical protein